jgi:hypothetical protein
MGHLSRERRRSVMSARYLRRLILIPSVCIVVLSATMEGHIVSSASLAAVSVGQQTGDLGGDAQARSARLFECIPIANNGKQIISLIGLERFIFFHCIGKCPALVRPDGSMVFAASSAFVFNRLDNEIFGKRPWHDSYLVNGIYVVSGSLPSIKNFISDSYFSSIQVLRQMHSNCIGSSKYVSPKLPFGGVLHVPSLPQRGHPEMASRPPQGKCESAQNDGRQGGKGTLVFVSKMTDAPGIQVSPPPIDFNKVEQNGSTFINLDSPDGLGRQDRRPRKRWRSCRFLLSPVGSVRIRLLNPA